MWYKACEPQGTGLFNVQVLFYLQIQCSCVGLSDNDGKLNNFPYVVFSQSWHHYKGYNIRIQNEVTISETEAA